MSAIETTATPTSSKTGSIERAPAPTRSVVEKPKVVTGKIVIEFHEDHTPKVTVEGKGITFGAIERAIPKVYKALGHQRIARRHGNIK